MTEPTKAAFDALPPVQKVPCSQCHAEPGEPCEGSGQGWHLSRFDRLQDLQEDA